MEALRLEHIGKSFESAERRVVANEDVNLAVAEGEVHAIVGENGAGKSTAMKMLYGMFQPDSGKIFVRGQERSWASPRDAIAIGIGMVHQHFMLAGPETGLENILLGSERTAGAKKGFEWLPGFFRPVDRRGEREKMARTALEHGLEVDLDRPVETLAVGTQQRLEILKLLYRGASILILDEPTAVLTLGETQVLFGNLRSLARQGKSILLITHKLKEVMDLSDRVTVFRAGKSVRTLQTRETSVSELAELMVGRQVRLPGKSESSAGQAGKSADSRDARPVLRFREVSLEGELEALSFEVQPGEILGIVGVEGNGQSAVLNLISGTARISRKSGGLVEVLGQAVFEGAGKTGVRQMSSRRIRGLSLGIIPEDRHAEGLLLNERLLENFLLGRQRDAVFSGRGWIWEAHLRARASEAMEAYDVRPRDLGAKARTLSGGNQQKVIIARELGRKPRLLVAAQPTRGVDIGAIEFIHGCLRAARGEGAGILLVSSELDEVLALSDRVLVLYRGRIAAEFSAEEADETKIGLAMGGEILRRAGSSP